jgi:hypothetical protein
MTMDKVIAGDRVRLNIQHRRSRREPLGTGEMLVVQTRFIAHKHDGEALCKKNGVKDRWISFNLLSRVKREGTPDEKDGMDEVRKLARLGLGNMLSKNVPYDPRAEYLTEEEIKAGKGTPNTWHHPNSDRKPYNPDELKEIAEKNRALIDELTRSA